MTSRAFMNTDYSSEVGTIKDYRERTPFCYAGRATRAPARRRRHKNVRATFHLRTIGISISSFLFLYRPRWLLFYYILDRGRPGPPVDD